MDPARTAFNADASTSTDAAPAADPQTAPPAAVINNCRKIIDDLGSVNSEAEAIELLRELEALKSAASAEQARTSAVLEQLRHNDEALRGVDKARRGKGLDAEIGLARGDSPARGSKHLNLANALTQDLPKTFAALREGRIHEEHAQVVAKETSWLSAENRGEVDTQIHERLGTLGPRKLGAEVRAHAQRLDQAGAVKRLARAKNERRVSARPAPEGMAYLSALLPMEQAVAMYSGLHRDATTMVGTGETSDPADPNGQPRTRDQIMADLLVERVTGQATAPAIPAEVQLVMTDEALFGDGEDPAWIANHGPIPAETAKRWLADSEAAVSLRRIFTRPKDNQLIGMESRARLFPARLRQMVLLRDHTCRSPYCDAPIREIDHIVPDRDGGPTSWSNSSGLCAACNQTKDNTGWRHQGDPEHLTVTTPTGHQYSTNTPPIRGGPIQNTGPPDEDPPDDEYETSSDISTCWVKVPTFQHTLVVAA